MTDPEPTSDLLSPGQLERLRSTLRDDVTVIANYQLEELLGEGGFGVVYRATQLEPVRRTVAIKILKRGMDSAAIIQRFELERQALATMNHPGIAQVFDAGLCEDGRHFFAMEYVAGSTLTAWADERKLSVRRRLSLFAQLCDAVAHAHQKGIIHRDIKPSNVMVTESDGQPIVKIIDFGIAKAVEADGLSATQITQGLMLIGTPEYMSPEQTRGGQFIETRSDVYALGVLLYELLAGRLPFERTQLQQVAIEEVYRLIRDVDPPRPSTKLSSVAQVDAALIAEARDTQPQPLIRELRRELEWIPLKAMRKDPSKRYRSATEFADDIRNYLTNQPLIAGPESSAYRVHKFLRRYRWQVAGVTAIAASLILGAIGTTFMAIRAERQRRLAESRFQDVRQLANTLIFDFYDSIRHLAGATPAIRQLVDTGQTYLEKLEAASDVSLDDELWIDIGKSYNKLADVQGNPGHDNLGDLPGALASFAKAESIFRQWLRQHPEDHQAASELADALIGQAVIKEYQGKLEEALSMFQRALEIDESVYRQAPDNVTLHHLHGTHFLIGALWQRRGNSRRALEEFQAALSLVESDPEVATDEQLQTDVAMTLGRIGTLQADLGTFTEADESLRRALDVSRHLAEAKPDDATRQRNQAIIGDQLARLYLLQDRAEQALTFLQTDLELFRKLSAADPDNVRARRDVAKSLIRIGDVLLQLDRHDEALATFEALVQQAAEIHDQYPTFENRRLRVNAVERVARALIAAERFQQALPHQLRVIELREQLLTDQPDNPVIQQEFAFALVILATVRSELGQPAEALAASEKAMAIHQQLLATTPDRDGSVRRLANSLAQSAKVLLQLDRREEAMTRFQRAVDLRRDYLNELTHSIDRQAGLAVTLAQYAEGLEQVAGADDRHWTDARATYQESLDLFSKIEEELSDEEREVLAMAHAGLRRCDEALARQ